MKTIATKYPGTAAAGTAEQSSPTGRNFNLRAFLAGGAATIALIAAGVIIFGSLAAYVAFNGLPVGGGDSAADSVAVQASGAGAPQNAAATLGAAPGAVAATAAAAAAIAPAPGTAGAPGTGETGTGTATPGTGGTVTDPGTVTPPGTAAPAATTPSGTAPAASTPGSSGESSSSGAVGNAVQGVDDAAAGAGVDLPLEATDPITQPVDETVGGALNGVGGALGNPTLGDQVNGAVSGLTNQVLGGN